MLRDGAILTLFVISAAALACGSDQPFTKTEEVDLSGQSNVGSAIQAETGSRLEVVIQIEQEGDEWAICGRPAVKDVFGNLLAVLSARGVTPGVRSSYQYAFYSPAAGQYAVQFDMRECNIRLTPARATVIWTVYHR
jgi:hypothetical protein